MAEFSKTRPIPPAIIFPPKVGPYDSKVAALKSGLQFGAVPFTGIHITDNTFPPNGGIPLNNPPNTENYNYQDESHSAVNKKFYNSPWNTDSSSDVNRILCHHFE